jgi:hypothetical protein
MTKDKRILISVSLVRVLLTYATLFYAQVNPVWKILLVIMYDSLDCGMANHALGMYKDKSFCRTEFYQKLDKVTDVGCALLVLCYLRQITS